MNREPRSDLGERSSSAQSKHTLSRRHSDDTGPRRQCMWPLTIHEGPSPTHSPAQFNDCLCRLIGACPDELLAPPLSLRIRLTGGDSPNDGLLVARCGAVASLLGMVVVVLNEKDGGRNVNQHLWGLAARRPFLFCFCGAPRMDWKSFPIVWLAYLVIRTESS
jgi:hypothetical protein